MNCISPKTSRLRILAHRRFEFILLGILICGTPVFGQENEDGDPSTQIWIDVNPIKQISDKLEAFGDAGLRFDRGDNGVIRLVFRPGIRRWLGMYTRVMGGIGSFYTWNQNFSNRWEIRPWVGFRYLFDRAVLPFDHYARLELRAEYNTNTWEVVRSARIRYRLRSHVNLSAFKPGTYWRALGSIELFGTLTGEQGQFQEKFRLGVGVERSFSTGLRLRLDATWQKSGRLFNASETDALYLRIRFFKII